MRIGKYLHFGWLTYLILFYGLWGLLFGLFAMYSQSNFSRDKLKNMVELTSKWEKSDTNPCKLQLVGEPVDSGNSYVKIRLQCTNGNSNNTISLKPLSELTLGSVIRLLGSVNMFDPEIILGNPNRWKCSIDGNMVTSESIIRSKNQIVCEER